MKIPINQKYFAVGGFALITFGTLYEVLSGVRHYQDVTIVGKVIGVIVAVAIVVMVGYSFFAMGKQYWTKWFSKK